MTSAPLSRDLLLQYLEKQGIDYVFGNPGTTELPLVDACDAHPTIRYVLSLHEDIAVAQATGYARASGKIGVVNLHVAPGLAHGLGNLYNAYRARVPLLITAGQHYTGLQIQEPILTADLAAMARPFTKWAYEVTRLDEMPIALQRAFKELTTPPYAPVFLSFPMNLLLEEAPTNFPPPHISTIAPTQTTPHALTTATHLLTTAHHPIIIAGDGIGHAHAWNELTHLAETIAAPIYTEGYSTLANCPPHHPLYHGPMPNQPTDMRNRFNNHDTAILIGVTSQAPVSRYDDAGPLIPWHLNTIIIDDNPWDIGKNQPTTIGILGDIKTNLQQLNTTLHNNPLPTTTHTTRTTTLHHTATQRTQTWETKITEARAATTITPTLIAAELRDLLPPNTIYVDETISNRPSFTNILNFNDPHAYFAANGLSLGYSPAAAVGIKMAQPHRPVVNIVGDGSLMYYPQALWNAAHEQTPILFIVLNNREYRVLKMITNRMGGPWGNSTHIPTSLNINKPTIDFVTLAQSLGIQAQRVTTPTQLHDALTHTTNLNQPHLIDVTITQTHHEP